MSISADTKTKADTAADIKEVVDFAGSFRYMLDIQINQLRNAI